MDKTTRRGPAIPNCNARYHCRLIIADSDL